MVRLDLDMETPNAIRHNLWTHTARCNIIGPPFIIIVIITSKVGGPKKATKCQPKYKVVIQNAKLLDFLSVFDEMNIRKQFEITMVMLEVK